MMPRDRPEPPGKREAGGAATVALRQERRLGTGLRVGGLLYVALLWALYPFSIDGSIALLWAVAVLLAVVLWQTLEARATLILALLTDGLLIILAVLLDPTGDAMLLPLLLSLKVFYLAPGFPSFAPLPLLWSALYLVGSTLQAGTLLWQQPRLWTMAGMMLALSALLAWFAHRHGHQGRQAQSTIAQGQVRSELLTVRHRAASSTATTLAAEVADLKSLKRVVQAVNSEVEQQQLLALIKQQMAYEFQGSRMAILVLGKKERFRLWSTPGEATDPDYEATLLTLARRQRQRQRPLLISRPSLSVMAVPLTVRKKQSGVLIAWRGTPTPFTQAHLKRLELFAEQASLAVHNSQLYEQLRRLLIESRVREAQLETILKSLGDGVVVTTRAGTDNRTNPAAQEFFRLLRGQEEARAAPFRAHMARVREVMERATDGHAVQAHFLLAQGQEERHFHALSTPLYRDGGPPRGVVTVLRDVTDERQVEQQKANFVSSVSHELRTPLHAIKSASALLLTSPALGPLTDQQEEFLEIMRREADKLEHLVLDLLEFNRLESGPLPIHPQRFNLTALLDEQIQAFKAHAIQQAIIFEGEIAEALYITADRRRIEQVIRNLLMNAFKFTPAGGLVRLKGQWERDGWVRVSVEDSGIGIPPEHQSRIFERFYQVDGTLNPQSPGMGVGLTLSKHIVDQHGGRLLVRSDGKQGTTFHLLLPPTPRMSRERKNDA